jgi:hypothetical protein
VTEHRGAQLVFGGQFVAASTAGLGVAAAHADLAA